METSWCFSFYGFHRRDSRGPVAASNHKKKTTMETITKFLATTEPIKRKRQKS